MNFLKDCYWVKYTYKSLKLQAIPNGMRKALNWVRETCNNPRILITENGYGDLGGLDDEDRVQYYKDYLGAMLDAIEDGCNVATYTSWSLMDNFEWDSGYW